MIRFAYLSHGLFVKVIAARGAKPFAVAGLARDGATTPRPGARLAAGAVRCAGHVLCDAVHPLFEVSPIGAHDPAETTSHAAGSLAWTCRCGRIAARKAR